MKLYRVMSRKEYEILEEKGFEATFKRKWKYFTTNIEYIAIILDEIDYGLWKGKYEVVVEFEIEFDRPLEELVKHDIVRIFRERGYTTIALSVIACSYIKSLKHRVLDQEYVLKHKPRPLLEWVSKKGRICRVYRLDKARRIYNEIKERKRIIYVAKEIFKNVRIQIH